MAQPRLPSELIALGIAAARQGEKAKASDYFRDATKIDSQHEAAWLWLAGATSDSDEAIHSLEQVLRLNPHNDLARRSLVNSRLEAGIKAAKTEDRELARKHLRLVCSLDSTNEMAWLWLAGITESPVEAIGHLEQILRLNPNHEQAKLGIEYFKSKIGEIQQEWLCPICLNRSNTNFTTCPNCCSVLSLSRIDEILSNPPIDPATVLEGIERLESALSHHPSFSTHYYLGVAKLNLKTYDSALAHFRKAKELRPEDSNYASQLDTLEQWLGVGKEIPIAPVAIDEDEDSFSDSVVLVAQTAPVRKKRSRHQLELPPVIPPELQKSILVVESNNTLRKLIVTMLNKFSYRTVDAMDGEEAMDKIASDPTPDLMILEATSSGDDGYALCKKLRDRMKIDDIPVIMLSEKNGFVNKLRGKMAGSTLNLLKPFEPLEMLKIVTQHCPNDQIRA